MARWVLRDCPSSSLSDQDLTLLKERAYFQLTSGVGFMGAESVNFECWQPLII